MQEYSNANSDENPSPITFNPGVYNGGQDSLGSLPMSPCKQDRKSYYLDEIVFDIHEESEYPSSTSVRKKTNSSKWIKPKSNPHSHKKDLIISLLKDQEGTRNIYLHNKDYSCLQVHILVFLQSFSGFYFGYSMTVLNNLGTNILDTSFGIHAADRQNSWLGNFNLAYGVGNILGSVLAGAIQKHLGK
jgi:hypothetical protein